MGSKIERKPEINFDYGLEIWSAMMRGADSPSFYNHLFPKGYSSGIVMFELVKWFMNSSNYTLPALIMTYAESLPDYFPFLIKKFTDEGHALRKQVRELLGENGVLVFPSYSVLAPKHNHAKFFPIRFAYAAIFNILGLPVTQVPIGVAKSGLPMGVQIISNEGNDHITIAIAQELEKKFGGWQLDKLAK